MAEHQVPVAQVMLVEYAQLKSEQSSRVGFRDNLLYATLGSMAAVVAATLSAPGHPSLLLLLPPVSVLLGWTYLVNDEKISAIGRYIRVRLAPELARVTGGAGPVFSWESEHRSDARRPTRKVLQLLVDLTTFCGSPLAAIGVYAASGRHTAPFLTVASVEAVAVGVLTVQIYRYADLRGRSQPEPGELPPPGGSA